MPEIGPAIALAVVLATFHVALYVLIRNRLERHAVAAWPLAVAGALLGNALGQRVGIDPLRIGEFHMLWASAGAWAAIGLASLLALLGPPARQRRR